MVSVKKYFTCKCGAASSFEFASEMLVDEVAVSGRCPSCLASIHVSLSSLLGFQPPQSSQPKPSETATKEMTENIEQAVRDLFKY
ncbi:MAG: hypothetical protein N3G80_02955 [Candidatus Micrarchaeota archaeon]|nr:hypothetical protein [Candidatus Micrarchaeota archaeon]